MKKAVVWIILALILLVSAALAGDSFPGGEYTVSVLSTNTLFKGDTTLRINDSIMDGEQSITCEGKLTFTVEGDRFLVLDRGSGPAVKAAEIELKGTSLIYPENGSIGLSGSDRVIVDSNGNPASKVILGPGGGWQAVTESTIKTSKFRQPNLLILQDTKILLDNEAFLYRIYDPMHASKVVFAKDTGAEYLTVRNYNAIPIDVGEIVIDSALSIANPRGGKADGGVVKGVAGDLAVNIVIARVGKYKISTEDCFTETDYLSLNSADEGDLVSVRPDWSPSGKYMSGVSSPDVTVKISEDANGKLKFTFTMPAKDIKLKAEFQSQIPYTFHLEGKTEIPASAETGLRGSLNFLGMAYSIYTYSGGEEYFDLDKDGTNDLIRKSGNRYFVADTCSLGNKWTSPELSGEKYSPLTFIFKTDPAPDPAPAPTSVTVGNLKYKLSGSKAIVTGPKSKNAKKLTIPKTITVGGKIYKVTEIKAGAFKNMKKLTAVTIGANVKTIGKQAFYKCKKLKTITIKSTLLTKKSVKSAAFKGISAKATIKCPKKKLKDYKKFLPGKGVPKTAKIR